MTDLDDPPEPAALPIDLRLPPDASIAKVLRLAASGVVAPFGYGDEEIEEVQLAASEMVMALIRQGTGEAIDVRFVVSSDEVTMEASTPVGRAFDLDHPDVVMCRAVLDTVCTEHDVQAERSVLRISVTLRRPFPGI